MDDQLSAVFDLVGVRCVVSGGFAVRGPWVTRAAVEGVKFLAVLGGHASLTADDVDRPVALAPGDVALLNDRRVLTAQGGTGDGPRREVVPEADFDSARVLGADPDADIVLGGHLDLSPTGHALLSQALPPLVRVAGSAPGADPLRASLYRLFDEVTSDRPGAAFAVRQHSQLVMLEILRGHLQQAEVPPGWLRLLTDPRLHLALRAMHENPGHPWGLRELARIAAMSRTSFAARFRAVGATTPLAYLHRWRMTLARRALREADTGVSELARELGYSSPSAFSTAFTREFGEPPLHYRRRDHTESTTDSAGE